MHKDIILHNLSGSWDIIPALIDLGHLVFPEEEEGEAIKCVRYSVLKLMLMVVMRSVSIISTFQSTKTFQCTTLYGGRLEGLECKYF